jgi:hypothetical protein
MSGPAFSCIIILDIHGKVFIEGDDDDDEEFYIPSLYLKQIGRDGGADVVCVVSPSNIGYGVYVNRTNDFPTLYQALMLAITSSPNMVIDGDTLSRLFNSYEEQLYPFMRDKHERRIDELTGRLNRGSGPSESTDYTSSLLRISGSEMIHHDSHALAQETYNALGMRWEPHYEYCIGSKKYCPGGSSNQCWLYFPGVAPEDCLRLRSMGNFVPPPGHSLSSDLVLRFDTTVGNKCVLVIEFKCRSDGRFNNDFWRGITLDVFFQQVKKLLVMVFSLDDALRLLAHTTFVDAACSALSVDEDGKKVSIISFQKAGTVTGLDDGSIIALLDVHDTDVHPRGLYEAKLWQGKGAAAMPSSSILRRVVIPPQLSGFVPGCLTCMGSTITKIKPEFDETGMVERVVYTYKDGPRVIKDYAVSVPELPTDTMETVVGSVEPHRDDLDYFTRSPKRLPLNGSDDYSDSSVTSNKHKKRRRSQKSPKPRKKGRKVGGCRCRSRRVLYTSKKKCNKCKMINLRKKTRKNR